MKTSAYEDRVKKKPTAPKAPNSRPPKASGSGPKRKQPEQVVEEDPAPDPPAKRLRKSVSFSEDQQVFSYDKRASVQKLAPAIVPSKTNDGGRHHDDFRRAKSPSPDSPPDSPPRTPGSPLFAPPSPEDDSDFEAELDDVPDRKPVPFYDQRPRPRVTRRYGRQGKRTPSTPSTSSASTDGDDPEISLASSSSSRPRAQRVESTKELSAPIPSNAVAESDKQKKRKQPPASTTSVRSEVQATSSTSSAPPVTTQSKQKAVSDKLKKKSAADKGAKPVTGKPAEGIAQKGKGKAVVEKGKGKEVSETASASEASGKSRRKAPDGKKKDKAATDKAEGKRVVDKGKGRHVVEEEASTVPKVSTAASPVQPPSKPSTKTSKHASGKKAKAPPKRTAAQERARKQEIDISMRERTVTLADGTKEKRLVKWMSIPKDTKGNKVGALWRALVAEGRKDDPSLDQTPHLHKNNLNDTLRPHLAKYVAENSESWHVLVKLARTMESKRQIVRHIKSVIRPFLIQISNQYQVYFKKSRMAFLVTAEIVSRQRQDFNEKLKKAPVRSASMLDRDLEWSSADESEGETES